MSDTITITDTIVISRKQTVTIEHSMTISGSALTEEDRASLSELLHPESLDFGSDMAAQDAADEILFASYSPGTLVTETIDTISTEPTVVEIVTV